MNKKIFFVMLLLVFCLSFTFADAASDINTTVYSIANFFGKGWVKGLACIALIAEAIGLIVGGGQNPQVFKKFLPLIAGTIIFMCAGKIINLVMGPSNTTTDYSTDLQNTTASCIQKTQVKEIIKCQLPVYTYVCI